MFDMVPWSTAMITVLGGVTVFVIGQFLLKWMIDPLQEYRELKGEIAHALLYHAEVYEEYDPANRVPETKQHLRELAGRLRKTHAKVPLYDLCSKLKLVPVRENLFKASTELVGWSNNLGKDGEKNLRRRTIAQCLGIDEAY